MWLGHIKKVPRTWSVSEASRISCVLMKYNETLPSDIHRRMRSLNHIKHWKGTEFRTILLYIGIVALKDFLIDEEYQMFLKLFCAVTICSSSIYFPYLSIARKLYIDFIEEHINLHGESSITINIHNLSHVVDDVEHFGPLNTISAYEFENCLHQLKSCLKQCRLPLEQIARRIHELTISSKVSWKYSPDYPKLKHQFILRDSPDVQAFRHIEYKPNTILSTVKKNERNRWILTHKNNIVEYDFIIKNQDKIIIRGSALKKIEIFFTKPFNSNYINIYSSDGEKNDPQDFDMSDLKAKLFCLPYETKLIFIPLLHTL